MSTFEALTDDELSEQLDKLGYVHPPVTPTTRGVLERKLAQLVNKEVLPSSIPEVTNPMTVTAVSDCVQEEDKSKGCYLLLYSGSVPDSLTLKQCYYHKEELHGVLKVLKGARFKWFATEEEAIAAYNNIQAETKEDTVPVTVTNKESASIYPSVSTVALNKFRKLIEDGKIEEFRECVWNNPRYLVTAGDAPELLKPGTRYNALHVAARSNRVEFCKDILNIVESMDFWIKLYPDDTQESRCKRRKHVVDLYLNMPDKIANETPLHFACKYGHEEVVKLLLNHPEIDKSGRSSAGLTAREIICQNNRQGSVAKKIDNLFEEVSYVPVYRSVDNSVPPVLGAPCSLEDCHSPPQPNINSGLSQSPVKPLLVGRAFAGPMSPAKAKDFRKRWRSPSKTLESIKRTDADKGLERVGRHLAYQDKTQWSEYWEFLGEFCDFSKPDGLEKLEQYLGGRTNDSTIGDFEDPIIDSLTSKLSNIALTPTPQRMFLTGSIPTKLDLSVMIALDEASVDFSKYPKVASWHHLVNSYPQEDKMSWLTPKKSAQFYSPHVTPGTGGATNYSPLIYRTAHIPITDTVPEIIPTSLDLNFSS